MRICLNSHGTRVIQKYLDKVYTYTSIMEVFNMLFYPNLLELILNQHSTHIIIKYLTLFTYENNKSIVAFLCKHVQQIATHKHSCCTYQKCVMLVKPIQQKQLLLSIANTCEVLFNDKYGNYLTQFALELKIKEINAIIINKYFNNFIEYSSQKIASNVFEKCFEFAEPEVKIQIIANICTPSMVKQLLFNMYGNYILQKAMIASDEPYRTMFLQMVAPLMGSLSLFPFGNIVICKLLNTFPELESMRHQYQCYLTFFYNEYLNSLSFGNANLPPQTNSNV